MRTDEETGSHFKGSEVDLGTLASKTLEAVTDFFHKVTDAAAHARDLESDTQASLDTMAETVKVVKELAPTLPWLFSAGALIALPLVKFGLDAAAQLNREGKLFKYGPKSDPLVINRRIKFNEEYDAELVDIARQRGVHVRTPHEIRALSESDRAKLHRPHEDPGQLVRIINGSARVQSLQREAAENRRLWNARHQSAWVLFDRMNRASGNPIMHTFTAVANDDMVRRVALRAQETALSAMRAYVANR